MPQNTGEPEVLTLQEAAEFLRVTPDAVEQLIADKSLPARKIGNEWRLLRESLRYWLLTIESKQAMLASAGAFKDDPYLAEITEEIYRNRGRSITEE